MKAALSRRSLRWPLVALAVIGAGATAYQFGLQRVGTSQPGTQRPAHPPEGNDGPATPSPTATPPAQSAVTERRVLYWHDPMVPGPRFDKPGKSPFMDMELVPVYAGEAGEAGVEGGVNISPRMQQSLGIRTAEVRKGTLSTPLQVTGSVTYNERDQAVVTARNNGYVEKLYVRSTLQPVRQGEPLAQLYVPEWVAAQEEYLSARRLDDARIEGLAAAARQRMALTGMPEAVMRKVETDGVVHARITVTAPIAGVVSELAVREGATLSLGTALFRINGLRTVWVNAEVPESAARQVRPGMPAQARSAAYPDQAFAGEVNALLPEVNVTTRTLKARIEVRNAGARLVPGMFVTVQFPPVDKGEQLVVPSEALIRTGTRTLVFVAEGDGRFTPVDVETGDESHGETAIRRGLYPGQQVVVSGQFLVDSEASLRSVEGRMQAAPMQPQESPSPGPAPMPPAAHSVPHAQAPAGPPSPAGARQ